MVPRIAVLMRNQLGPAAPRATAAAGSSQLRLKSSTTFNGPNGQQSPPPKPGGPEAVKRNWVPVGGAALAAVAAYAYLTSSQAKVTVDKAKQTDGRDPSPSELESLADAAKDTEQLGQQVAGQTAKTMKEMSGRQKTAQGSFRHD